MSKPTPLEEAIKDLKLIISLCKGVNWTADAYNADSPCTRLGKIEGNANIALWRAEFAAKQEAEGRGE